MFYTCEDSVTSNHEIDIVITWVDGADPLWRSKRARFVPEKETCLATASVEGRYRNNDELRYLLRSIERHWHSPGKIYLVTDAQVPDFLATHPRLVLVDHSDIIAPENLPVFSSRAIEANLHRIPGLSEYFVAFNDDLFLTRDCSASDFFGTLGAVVYLTDCPLPTSTTVEQHSGHNDGCNAREWLRAHFLHPHINEEIEHYPKGVRRSWMEELEQVDSDIFEQIGKERFRTVSGQSILANLYGHWCAALGRATIRRNECAYLASEQIESDTRLTSLSDVVKGKLCLCINDTTDDRMDVSHVQRRIQVLLHALFPTPSCFEKKELSVIFSDGNVISE